MINGIKIQRILASLIVVSILGSFVQPVNAFVGIPSTVFDPWAIVQTTATAVATGATAVSTALSAAQAGIPGTGAVATTPAATCLPLIAAVDTFDTAKASTNFLTSLAFGLIGESEFDAVKIEAELKTVGAAKVCVASYLKGSIGVPSVTQAVADDMIRTQLTFQHLDSVYGERIEMLTSRQSATMKQILRAVMLKILQNVEKDLTTRVVNGLVQKFKISNYLQYADALGGQVYAMDYINKNFEGDARQQMMVRQLVQSRLVGGQDGVMVAKAFAQDKAEQFIGYDFKNLDVTDPNMYLKLADLGSPNANPDYHEAVAQEQSITAYASGLANANLEISNGKGFLPPRDCSGSVSEQQALDQKQLELGRKYLAAQQVYAKLVQATPKVKPADLAQAKEALDAVQTELRALPQEVSKPVVEICKAIENPGGAVADQINSFLTKHLTEATDFKPENLPFFATFLSDVASNFITNIVTGGKGSGQLLKEAGLGILDSSFASNIDTATPAVPDSPTGGTIDPTNDTPGGTVNDTPGQSTPATCQQIKEALDQGVKLTCESLPSARGQQFIIKVDFTGLLTQYDPKNLSVSKLIILANGTPQSTNLEQGADIPSIVSAPGIITYLVDDGIQGPTEFLFSISGTLKNSSTIFSRNARIKTTLPTGQVQGLSTSKIFLRSYGPERLFTSPRPGITLR
jgi:hypothetical protein